MDILKRRFEEVEEEDEFYIGGKTSKESEDGKMPDALEFYKSSSNPNDIDLNKGLELIGKDNCKKLYNYIRYVRRVYNRKIKDTDGSNKKILLKSQNKIDNVTVGIEMYNTNDLMEPIYSSLEIKFSLEFRLVSNGLNFSKTIYVSGSQDFGGCSPADVKDLMVIIKHYCN